MDVGAWLRDLGLGQYESVFRDSEKALRVSDQLRELDAVGGNLRLFLPGSDALRQLVAAVRLYVGDEKGWDLQLVLKKEDVPLSHLGRAGRMGFNTWMGRYPKPADADDVVLRPVK